MYILLIQNGTPHKLPNTYFVHLLHKTKKLKSSSEIVSEVSPSSPPVKPSPPRPVIPPKIITTTIMPVPSAIVSSKFIPTSMSPVIKITPFITSSLEPGVFHIKVRFHPVVYVVNRGW